VSLNASNLVAGLTLDQKVALLSGADAWRTQAIAAANLPSAEVSDGPHGLRTETGVDMVWIPSTCFPTASALGATWDAELVARVGVALGEEASAMGVQVLLGPGVNMKRTPLCGRNFEYFAEDPVLAGDLAAAYITGLQSVGIGACLKHFAANNQETERMEISVEADERTLREIYLEAFRRAIAASDPWSVMCSYNRIGGVHSSQNRWLLTDILRGEWGYSGMVISDWDAVHDPVAAVSSGLDLEMPGTSGRSVATLLAALEDGSLELSVVEQAAARVVALVQRCLPDAKAALSPVRDRGITPGGPLSDEQRAALSADAHHALAREAAAAAITLLRNPDQLLPLNQFSEERIAVIGAYARVPRLQGGGSAGVDPLQVDQPLAAIRDLAGDRVSYAEGYPIAATDFYQEQARDQTVDADALQREAVASAEAAEVIIAFVGLPLASEVEAADRTSLALPSDQLELLAALQQTGKPLVVVLAAGSAVTMDPWHDRTGAILLTWLGGQGVGEATAQVLFGLADPSGRLSETYPLALADTPGYDAFPGAEGRVRYDEGVFIGYRWYDATHREVRYPFGHGLSYTSFDYSAPTLSPLPGQRLQVEATVTNTGARLGSEVVQLYVEPPTDSADRPIRELRAFGKVHLEPGESQTWTAELGVRDFAVADVDGSCWRQNAGTYRIVLASSSREPRLTVPVQRSAASVGFAEDHHG
jgi:beta-glucosidase